ncbi:hypothetical protein AB0H76_22750 [Nocardia sp. NPDC050712]|uniref:hypothetical protein n=1 Tax=Nocardia sp. NPDC050712 TaxID=3155518 RepID=UPI0033C63DB1
MAITFTRAKVLAALAALEPTETLTVEQLGAKTGFAKGTIRQGLQESAYEGFAALVHQHPPRWRLTREGRCLMHTSGLRDLIPAIPDSGAVL